MIFMGEEYGETRPFQFFTDHIDPFIADATREGRRREFAAFAGFSGEEVPDPQDPETFARSVLDPAAATRRCGSCTGGSWRCGGSCRADRPVVRHDADGLGGVAARGALTVAGNFGDDEAEVPVGVERAGAGDGRRRDARRRACCACRR